MADVTAFTTLRERLARRWPDLIGALPRQMRLVREGGNIGLIDDAVVVRRDWLTQQNLNALQHALLHLAAHRVLGHRPWRARRPEQHARLDREAARLLQDLGFTGDDADWHDDHHGQWQAAKASEPGLATRGSQASPSRSESPSQDRNAGRMSEEDATADRAEQTGEITPGKHRTTAFSTQAQGHRSAVGHASTQTPSQPADWRRLLQIWLTRHAWRNWRFDRPPRHSPAPFILPRLSGRDLNLAIALDISGSISDDWLGGFLREIDQLRNRLPMRLRLITCDNRIHSDRRDVQHPQLALDAGGGGGTDFRPVFQRLHGDATIDALLYCTDLAGEFPERQPPFPVFWLTPDTDRQPPFGVHLTAHLD